MDIKEIAKYLKVSTCSKYVYPRDSVTGRLTFAPIDYFIKNVEKKFGGSLERFVKEYQTRETKKYFAAGYSKEQIIKVSEDNDGKLPKIKIAKKIKDPRVKKERKKRLNSHAVSTETISNDDGTETVKRVFPWSADPTNYFRSPDLSLSIAEATKDACLRPATYLDSECRGCEFYTECTCVIKYTKWRN